MPVDAIRDCPKCGSTTTAEETESFGNRSEGYRECDNPDCNWYLAITGGALP
ncbi:hypothetical protein [Haloarchaeobius sp. DYHT-AS-18]|uniref:hypothetical protein n=1 Tax=Haloarchaeobius sp. DYHT-AS-18 TaxID=3446117 RepID=UPI003EB6CD1A